MSVCYSAEIVIGFLITEEEYLKLIDTEASDYCVRINHYTPDTDFLFGESYYKTQSNKAMALPHTWTIPFSISNKIRKAYKEVTGKTAPFCTPFFFLKTD